MRTPHLAVLLLVTLLWPVIPVRSGGDEAGTGAVVSDRGASSRHDAGVLLDARHQARTDRERGHEVSPLRSHQPDVLRPVVQVPASPVIVVRRQPAVTRPVGRGGRAVGTASLYCGHGSPCTHGYPDGLYAAAGPALRVGNWRGRVVTVRSGVKAVRVRLIDWCLCTGGKGRVLDLYRSAFSRLADPSRGLVTVTVSW